MPPLTPPPPPDLYEDPPQPSRKGMLKRARNIKYPGAEFTIFQAGGYGPHLYPNSAIRHHSDQPAQQQQPERSDNFNKRQTCTIPHPPFFTSRRQPATHLSLHPGGTVLPAYHPPMAVPNVHADRFNNNHKPPIQLRRYHKPCASCRGSFSRSSRRKMERKKM